MKPAGRKSVYKPKTKIKKMKTLNFEAVGLTITKAASAAIVRSMNVRKPGQDPGMQNHIKRRPNETI